MQQLARDKSESTPAANAADQREMTLTYKAAPSGRRPLNSFGTCSVPLPKSARMQSQTPIGQEAPIRPIQSAPTVRFAQMARTIVDAARSLGLRSPGFMAPPRHTTADRTITRTGTRTRTGGDNKNNESCLVAVRVKGRPLAAIKADIIEGVIVANNLTVDEAVPVRKELWCCLTTLVPDD